MESLSWNRHGTNNCGVQIARGEIGSPQSGAITDQELMLEQQRFRGEGADATRTEELGNGDKQMDGEDQQFAYERTLPRLLPDARLPGTGGSRHTTNSPPTGSAAA